MFTQLADSRVPQIVVVGPVMVDTGGTCVMPWEPAAAVGSVETFEDCAADWAEDLARLAFLLTGDADAADDLVADALFAAWKQWSTVMAARSPRAYVRRIVVNLAASQVRKLVRDRSRLRLIGSSTSDAVQLPDLAGGVDLRRALEDLPRGQRECVVLRYGMDMSEREVAEVLQISVGTVKSQTSKGAARLRHLLEPAALT
jgi:RNA polymerase sigma-70 factor (sigma-E family)